MPIQCIKKNVLKRIQHKKSKKKVVRSRQCLLKDKIIRHITLRTSPTVTISIDFPFSASPAAFFAADTSTTMGGSSAAACFVGGNVYI